MADEMVSKEQQNDTVENTSKIENVNLNISDIGAKKEEEITKAVKVANKEKESGSGKKKSSSKSAVQKHTVDKTKTITKTAKTKKTKNAAKTKTKQTKDTTKVKQKASSEEQTKLEDTSTNKKELPKLDGYTNTDIDSAEPAEKVASQNALENKVAEQNDFGTGVVADKNKEDSTHETIKKSKAKHNYSRAEILTVSALGYLFVFLPFIFCREEPYARYHLNQALVLWIFAIPLYLIFAFIPNVNIVAIPVICMFHILGIMVGFAYAVRGRAKHLPLIGRITIIKWER